MDVLKMRFTPPFTLRSRRSRNDPGSSAAAENLLRRCPKRAGSLKSARGSAHGDAQRVCYILQHFGPRNTLRGLLAVQHPMRSPGRISMNSPVLDISGGTSARLYSVSGRHADSANVV